MKKSFFIFLGVFISFYANAQVNRGAVLDSANTLFGGKTNLISSSGFGLGYYKYIINDSGVNSRQNIMKTAYHIEDDTDVQIAKSMGMGLVCLLYSGFSILMREAVYNSDPLDNWLGSVNSFMTLGIGGAVTGFFFGFTTLKYVFGFSNDNGTILYWIGCTFVGALTGVLVHFAVPDIRAAFKENRALYYTVPAISGGLGVLGVTLSITLKIKQDKKYKEINDFFENLPNNNG